MIRRLGIVAVLALTAYAKDIENGQTVNRLSSEVEIFDVSAARILKQEVRQFPNSDVLGVKAILELTVDVQGNICTADPETLSLLSTHVQNFTYSLKLMVSADHQYDPWGVINACTMHGKVSTIKVPLKIDHYFAPAHADFQLPTYRLAFQGVFDNTSGIIDITLGLNSRSILEAKITKSFHK